MKRLRDSYKDTIIFDISLYFLSKIYKYILFI